MTIPQTATTTAHLWHGGIRNARMLIERNHPWLGMVVSAAITALLLWANLDSLIFLLGAFLSLSCYQQKQPHPNAAAQI